MTGATPEPGNSPTSPPLIPLSPGVSWQNALARVAKYCELKNEDHYTGCDLGNSCVCRHSCTDLFGPEPTPPAPKAVREEIMELTTLRARHPIFRGLDTWVRLPDVIDILDSTPTPVDPVARDLIGRLADALELWVRTFSSGRTTYADDAALIEEARRV